MRDQGKDPALQEWAERGLPKLRLISQAAEVPRPRDGDVAYADGTNWNPSAQGAGIYWYGLGSWYRLATGAGITLVDGDKGDVVVSGTGLVWTIDSNAVTFAKMQDIATDTLIGRATAGSGDPEEITCTAAGRALLDDASADAQRTTLGVGTGDSPAFTGITLAKTSGVGIKVDQATPTFGWRDIIGSPQEPVTGSGKPSWVQIATSGVYCWSFATSDTQTYIFHIPHDYVPGSDVHFHVHWFGSQTAGNSTRWQFDYLYSKGHQQAAFPTTATTVYAQQAQITTAYTHMIAETDAITIANCEVDGLLIVQVTRIAPTGGPSDVSGSVFVPCIDVHYQSTNMATKDKAPDFYA